VILTLEVNGPHAAKMGRASRHEFGPDGGSIGRESNNTWVLPHTKVSGIHALISYRNAAFHIEDRSRNGVCLNSVTNRLVAGRPYPLQSGDFLLIDPFEIRVQITEAHDAGRRPARVDRSQYVDDSNPFDPFAIRESPLPSSSDPDLPYGAGPGAELDPLKLLDLTRKQPAQKVAAPSARDLARGSPLEGHYRPPSVAPERPSPPAAPSPPWDPAAIPQDYDPLAPDDFPEMSAPPPTPPLPTPAPNAIPASWSSAPPPPAPPRVVETPPPAPAVPQAALEESPPVTAVPPQKVPAPAMREPAREDATFDLASMLAGAGLEGVEVTPELAQQFGEILRVVVAGVMDVLRARQQIKDEFRMRVTQFRRADNNPLKFSANVEDALHNLLVKRNAAYLGPVEAFEDAFDDLRGHQIAMLAGMRVAFEFMLAEFDPDRLQEQFDRQMKKGSSLLAVPAKLRYWDLYRERRAEMVKDPEESFRELFGEEFARAYEEQLKRLKTRRNDDNT
jgi:predicted component of type VI protein secretion system